VLLLDSKRDVKIQEVLAMVVKLAKQLVPPLENGDRLTRDEFVRRYEAMPESVKAELVNGVVYMASPVRLAAHGEPTANLIAWMTYYKAHTPGTRGGDNSTVRLDKKNEMQPDACLLIDPSHGGRCQIDAHDYIIAAPELVVEVSASSTSYDLHEKLEAYRDFGAPEYLVWRVFDQAIDWFVLRGGNYKRFARDREGILKSKIFPGLWLDPTALIRDDLRKVFRVLKRGLASPEHAAFLKRLSAKS